MRYIIFALLSRYFLNNEQGFDCLFLIQEVLFNSKCKKPFTPKSVMNKPQAEGRVNSRLYRRTYKKI